MIDFTNAIFLKLKSVSANEVMQFVKPLLIENEELLQSFKSIRDMVIFTNKRLIAINVQGITGTKKDFTSLPYSKVHSFSIETAGTFDLDCEMDLWFSELGKVRFEFKDKVDIISLNKLISGFIL